MTEIYRFEKNGKELKELSNQKKLLSIIEFLPDATFVIDKNEEVLAWNKNMEEMTGICKGDIIGKNNYVNLIYGAEQQNSADNSTKNIFDENNNQADIKDREIYLPGAYLGKGAYVQIKTSPLFDGHGNLVGVIKSLHDVTEMRKVESQLRQAQKMEAVGLLAGGIAHDFNNLLTGILGNVSSILSGKFPGEEHYEALKEIEHAASMAAEIIEKLLGFSRKSFMSSNVVNINDCICEICGILERTIDPRINIATDLAKDLWLAEADRTQIVQILINLCLNSQDAMSDGGTITIKTNNITIKEDSPKLQKSYVRQGDFVNITVADSGCGMSPEVLERIFEPFFTTKEIGHGTGLGLSMVYGIVKQLKGWIDCSSEPGEGTVFTIYLPRFSGEAIAVKQPAACPEVIELSGTETILVVDDKKIVTNFIRRVLVKGGYKTLTAGDGHEAIEFYRKYWKEIDLVILDMIMPKISGRDVLIAMKEINPAAKILLTSGYLFDNLKDHVLSGYEFLHKPFTENDLLRHLKKMLHTLP